MMRESRATISGCNKIVMKFFRGVLLRTIQTNIIASEGFRFSNKVLCRIVAVLVAVLVAVVAACCLLLVACCLLASFVLTTSWIYGSFLPVTNELFRFRSWIIQIVVWLPLGSPFPDNPITRRKNKKSVGKPLKAGLVTSTNTFRSTVAVRIVLSLPLESVETCPN